MRDGHQARQSPRTRNTSATARATVTVTETHPTQWEADYWATWNAWFQAL